MKVFDRFDEWLNEKNNVVYDYGCVMAYFNEPNWQNILAEINDEDLYTEENDNSYGKENECHCTILYGLHKDVDEEKLLNVISKFTKPQATSNKISCFNNEKYDVLKFDVVSDDLGKMNEELKQFPFTSNFPDYHAHITIAYLKPGLGEKYMKNLDSTMNLDFNKIVYSKGNGEKFYYNI